MGEPNETSAPYTAPTHTERERDKRRERDDDDEDDDDCCEEGGPPGSPRFGGHPRAVPAAERRGPEQLQHRGGQVHLRGQPGLLARRRQEERGLLDLGGRPRVRAGAPPDLPEQEGQAHGPRPDEGGLRELLGRLQLHSREVPRGQGPHQAGPLLPRHPLGRSPLTWRWPSSPFSCLRSGSRPRFPGTSSRPRGSSPRARTTTSLGAPGTPAPPTFPQTAFGPATESSTQSTTSSSQGRLR